MKDILFIIVIASLLIWILINDRKIKKTLSNLKSEMIDNEKLLTIKITDLKNNMNKGSEFILDEAKSHMDAALSVISKRIGKNKKDEIK